MKRIGIDFGKVIMGASTNGKEDTAFFGDNFLEAMQTPPSEKAFESISRIVQLFDGDAWIISKCGPAIQDKTKKWLDHWDFYRATGFKRQHIRFCLKRHEKTAIAEELRLNYFIDDRADVLEPMRGIVENLYLFGDQTVPISGWLFPVKNWQVAMSTIESHTR